MTSSDMVDLRRLTESKPLLRLTGILDVPGMMGNMGDAQCIYMCWIEFALLAGDV